jgi:hypothetical protein
MPSSRGPSATTTGSHVNASAPLYGSGGAGSRVTVVSLPARGRPPEAAARRAGLEFVEKLLTKLTSTDTTERNAMLRIPPRSIGRAG